MSATSTAITVSELTAAIKNRLEGGFPNICVQGEMSNAKLHSSGHLYFDLKDAGAKIPAVLFRNQASKLARPPKEGDRVSIKGALSVYPPHGKYQIIAKSLDYEGVGELLLRFEALKKKLHARGWFDADKKQTLPPFPKKIGVVTSPTGAVIRDIIHVLRRRSPGFELLLHPVRVQGNEAAYEIAEAIEVMNEKRLCDVLIVGRGGGSMEDLWPFNEEIVAKAIFESQIPIISAVGHETDVTLADFVADVRAPTPSAAAEVVSAEKLQHLAFLSNMRKQMSHSLHHQVKRYRTRLDAFANHPLFSSPYALLSAKMQRLDEIQKRLDLLMHGQLVQHKQKFGALVKHLQAVDPKNVLKRGYSVLFSLNEERVIVSAQEMVPGQEVEALLADGKRRLRVEDE